MTTLDYIQIVEYEMMIGEVTISIDRPTILTALNESAQRLREDMMAADEDLYTSTQAYGSGTSWPYASFPNYYRLRAVDGSSGVLPRRVGFEEFATTQYSTVEAGTSGSPIFKEDTAGLTFAPATAGTMYAIASFGEIVNDTTSPLNLNTDLTAAGTGIILWPFEEIFILTAVSILAERESQKPGVPESEVQKLMHVFQQTEAMLDQARKPVAIFNETRPTPKLMPKQNG